MSIAADKSVKEAMQIMIENDYSQLPVVTIDGDLQGLVSDQSLIQQHYFLNGASLLELRLGDCCTSPVTVGPKTRIFSLLKQLETAYAAVVVNRRKPVGIVTSYDTTKFFFE